MKNKNTIDDKLVKRALTFLLIIIVFFCLVIFIDNNRVKYIQDNYDIDRISNWQIEKIKEGTVFIKIEGWSFIPHKKNKLFITKILLKNMKNNSYIQINTDMKEKWEYIDPNNNNNIYRNVGFIATVNKYLLSKDTDYEVCILTTHNDITRIIFTDKIINM